MSLCPQSGIKAATLKRLINLLFLFFPQFFKCLAERREGSCAAAVEFKGLKPAEGDSLIIQVRLCVTAGAHTDVSSVQTLGETRLC